MPFLPFETLHVNDDHGSWIMDHGSLETGHTAEDARLSDGLGNLGRAAAPQSFTPQVQKSTMKSRPSPDPVKLPARCRKRRPSSVAETGL